MWERLEGTGEDEIEEGQKKDQKKAERRRKESRADENWWIKREVEYNNRRNRRIGRPAKENFS